MKRISLGHIAVDSGQLMITDPCRIDEHWKKEDYDPKSKPTPFSYNDISQKTQKGVHSSNFTQSKMPGAIIHFSSGFGDGLYQVWGYQDESGRIVKVDIDMWNLDTRIKRE
jgi:hypothetical protein